MTFSFVRKDWLDALKGYGILLVVMGHTPCPENLKIWIYGFHMPLFFVIAGYLYNESKWQNLGLYLLINDRLKKYIVPYLWLFVINLIITIIVDYVKKGQSPIEQYLIAGLWSHDTLMPNCAPLWFLTCLFVSYLYFWTIIKYKRYGVFVCFLYLVILFVVNKMAFKVGVNQLPWHIETALLGSVFMYVGFLFNQQYSLISFTKKQITRLILAVVLGSIIFFLNSERANMVINRYGNFLLFFLGAILVSLGFVSLFKLLQLERWLIRPLAVLGGG